MRAQRERCRRRAFVAEHALDRRHRAEQTLLALGRERREDLAHLVARALVEVAERAPAGRGQRERLAAPVGPVARSEHQRLFLEAGEQPRQVRWVEAEVRRDGPRGDAVPVGQLEQDPGLGQRERGGEQVAAQGADALRVPAVEAANRLDPVVGYGLGHLSMATVQQMMDVVN